MMRGAMVFQPSPPGWAETKLAPSIMMRISNFHPSPPVRAETLNIQKTQTVRRFQPSPPVRAETMRLMLSLERGTISTLSARAGGDRDGAGEGAAAVLISTLSARAGGDNDKEET